MTTGLDAKQLELLTELGKSVEIMKGWQSQLLKHEDLIGTLNQKMLQVADKIQRFNTIPFAQVTNPRKHEKYIQFQNDEDAKGFIDLFKAVMRGNEQEIRTLTDLQLRNVPEIQLKQMLEGTGADGGFLVAPQYATTILRLIDVFGLLRSLATVVPATSNLQYWVRLLSGITTYWIGENTLIPTTKPVFSQVPVELMKLAAWVPASNELISDSFVPIASLIATLVAESMSAQEDRVGFVGSIALGDPFNGVCFDPNVTVMYMGIGDTAFTDISWDYALQMQGQIKKAARRNARYVSEDTIKHQLMMTKASTSGVYFGGGPQQGAPADTWGAPHETTEVMPGIADVSDSVLSDDPFLLYGNLQNVIIADKGTLQIFVSPHFYAQTDVTATRFTTRMAILVGLPDAFVVLCPSLT